MVADSCCRGSIAGFAFWVLCFRACVGYVGVVCCLLFVWLLVFIVCVLRV